ncbi:protein of unknown function [Methylacidimicrobium sp. AP8]|uniref:PP2C family protein-serine/threonine phosphatase n=1 Tax=Methylacidimicrobium sp. AP8 TaxID=2730359 RepID=UPI0018C14B2A|nr:PP2C family protein-serine/threonine phosphatase [Methylacidimicrobium sp. AP8]CAB4244300.1 protein of unknown function [Methylacidimicrobium sp. AP8]
MEAEREEPAGSYHECLLRVAELGGALATGADPDPLIASLLERLRAFLDATAVGLLSGEAGASEGCWGPPERSDELRAIAERMRAKEESGEREAAAEGPWTLLPLRGNGWLAVHRDAGGGLRPPERTAALAVAEAVLHLLSRPVSRQNRRKRRLLEAELMAASLFQSSLFPRALPALPGFRLAIAHLPAGELSGDFCDVLPIDPHNCGILVGDVAGKGMAAALVGGMCRTAVRSQVAGCPSPAGVLRRVNRLLYGDLVERSLVAMIYAVVNTQTREIVVARAGHEPPLLRRPSGVSELDAPGFCLGIDSGEAFDAALADITLFLAPEELLLFYTDGMIDALAPCGARFDKGRLVAALARTGGLDARASLEALFRELASFRSSGGLADDVTLVALERVGS